VKQAIALLDALSEDDASWVLQTAHERDVPRGEVLVEEGQPVAALYVVGQGVLHVTAEGAPGRLAVLGPGDLVGEMSFLGAGVATATVRAAERAMVLSLPQGELHARVQADPSFSARLHRALAQLLAAGLRETSRRLAVSTETDAVLSEGHPAWQRLSGPLRELKRTLHDANDAASSHDEVPEGLSARIVDDFLGFLELMNEVVDLDVTNERVRDEIGTRVRQELMPYVLLGHTAERFYTKPRGYAGDYWMIELMYRNVPGGRTPVGRLVDRCFLSTPAAHAARNRRGLLADEIARAVASHEGPAAQITSLACGPAREVFDVFDARDGDHDDLHVTLLDIDREALDFVAGEVEERGLGSHVDLVRGNLIHLALGKAETEIRDQDLVYSIGLIDYFSDDLVVRLMDLVHRMLRPGGRVVLGNFHPRSPSRAVMDHVLDWKLVYRTEEDMDRLFERSAFGRPTSDIRFERQGINLFAACVR
jgi:extracellular factor (EF) 3-hydroxypalmitic acid methyl ester biosynthesis protein